MLSAPPALLRSKILRKRDLFQTLRWVPGLLPIQPPHGFDLTQKPCGTEKGAEPWSLLDGCRVLTVCPKFLPEKAIGLRKIFEDVAAAARFASESTLPELGEGEQELTSISGSRPQHEEESAL